jgi:predicted ATPase
VRPLEPRKGDHKRRPEPPGKAPKGHIAYARMVDDGSTSGLFILTGAPGSGKTAMLDRLSREFVCMNEPAREVLAEQRASGGSGTWDQDASLFVHLLLQWSIQKYEAARRTGQTVVFDRGIPDCVVYAVRLGADVAPSLEAIETFRYESDVFFLEPWSGIYRTDEERVMPFDDAVSFSDSLREVYEQSGYSLIDVPHGSIDHRTAFVGEFIMRRIETA